MSGVEALGLVLGVLPLLVSAIEHYDDALGPIHCYRRFDSRTQMFCDEYETERTVFQAECQLLLGEFVGLETAQKMISDPSHPSWRDGNLCRDLEGSLGQLGTRCLSTIDKMKYKLKEIDKVYKGFTVDIVQPSDGLSNAHLSKAKSAAYKQWLRTRKKRLKFAFSEGTLRNSLSDLRKQNEIFRVISGQIIRFDRKHSRNEEKRNGLSCSNQMRLKQLKIIRTASCKLYEALRSACSAHRGHLIKFCLEATCHESGNEDQVTFNIAYAPVTNVDLAHLSQSRSFPRESCKEEEGLSPFKSSMIEIPEVLGSPASELYTEAEWFRVESIMEILKKGTTESDETETTKGSSPNDVTDSHGNHLHASDLCIKLQTRTCRDGGISKGPVIVSNNAQSCRHCIYDSSDHVPSKLGKTSTSLTGMLSASNGHPIGNIPQLHRLRIARSLVTAVLQFYATPWLPDSWRSENLLFSSIESENWQSYISSPHLAIHITAADEPAAGYAAVSQRSMPIAPVVPNLMLFNLGIMLLELAYGVPFPSMLPSTDVNALTDTLLADYTAAYHLANNVGVYFGSGYAEIVRKCLRCDFGEGENLDNPALQERLYEDVVHRLERLEVGIRRSQGDI